MTVYDESNLDCFQEILTKAGSPDLELDIGCGKSDLCHALASLDPLGYYVGVDWNRDFCLQGEIRRRKLGLENVAFVNMEASAFLRKFVKSASARMVYILFPSPVPKPQRLITEPFLWEVFRVLGSRGELRLITDDAHYYAAIRRSLRGGGWEEDFWTPLPFNPPQGFLVGTPCEEEYGSHFVLRLVKRS